MNLAIYDVRFTMYDLRGSDGVITALAIRASGDLRCVRKSYIVNRQWLRFTLFAG